jgi:hypothetical protein
MLLLLVLLMMIRRRQVCIIPALVLVFVPLHHVVDYGRIRE